jgi:hypothetical protein
MGRPPRFAGHDPVGGDLEVGEGGEQFAEERPDWLLSRTWPIAAQSSTWGGGMAGGPLPAEGIRVDPEEGGFRGYSPGGIARAGTPRDR